MPDPGDDRLRERPEFFLFVSSLGIVLLPGLFVFAWTGIVAGRIIGAIVMIGGLALAGYWANRLYRR